MGGGATGSNALMTTKPKLLDQMRQVLRMKRYSYETEQAYVH